MSVHSHRVHHHRRPDSNGEAFAKVAVLLLGLLVGTLAVVAVLLWADARQSREEGSAAAGAPAAAAHDHAATDPNTAMPINSFAGVVPATLRRWRKRTRRTTRPCRRFRRATSSRCT